MVRPREGGFCYTDHEFSSMLEDAAALLAAGADDIVFGILHKAGTVDKERCAQMHIALTKLCVDGSTSHNTGSFLGMHCIRQRNGLP